MNEKLNEKLKVMEQKAVQEYPCHWLYKVIGNDQEHLRKAIAAAIGESEVIITYSNSSSSGKYHCLNLELVVASEEERNGIYQLLKEHPQVRLVL